MDYQSIGIAAFCWVVILMALFILDEWARSKGDDNSPSADSITRPVLLEEWVRSKEKGESPAVSAVQSELSGEPADKWTKFRLFMDRGDLKSDEAKKVIREIKDERPDGWVGKLFSDV